ncbi:Nup85 nucleoporin-domain-containing protein [Myxozyma melibiosi]|uniref:Nuclear pore complex protein Nup85 n=1 Tax=Myxozyma melibiosi TaxID=54550 RepID=A0ABR1F891_9ASCO
MSSQPTFNFGVGANSGGFMSNNSSSSAFSFGGSKQPMFGASSASASGFMASTSHQKMDEDEQSDQEEEEEEEEEDEEDDDDDYDYDYDDFGVTSLPDAPVARGMLPEFSKRDRTLKFLMDPVLSEGAAWIARKHLKADKVDGPVLPEETKLYPALVPGTKRAPEYSSFIVESHNLFIQLQLAAQEAAASTQQPTIEDERILPRFANQFLQVVDAWRRRVPSALEPSLSDAYVLCHCLVATYFVDPSVTRAEAVMNWLNQSMPRPTTEETRDIMTSLRPVDQPGFWNLVHLTATRGLFLQCSNCLKQSAIIAPDQATLGVLQSAISVLESAPKGTQAFLAHRQWRARAITFGDDAARLADPGLRHGLTTLSRILRGDINTLFAFSETWQEATAALFLLHDPSPARLTEYFDLATKEFPIDSTLLVDEGCAALFANNIAKALVCAEGLDICVAAHMADFCDRQRMLDDFIDVETIERPSIRDYLFIRHAEVCFAMPELFVVGVAYLRDTDVKENVTLIRNIVTQIYPEDEEMVEHLLVVCDDVGLDTEKGEIVTAWSKLQLSRNEIGSALHWLSSVHNYVDTRAVVWTLVERSLLQGGACPLPDAILGEFLTSPGLCPDVIREFIAPYAIYYSYRQQLMQISSSCSEEDEEEEEGGRGSLKEAAMHLASLIQFAYLPRKYALALIAELLALLQLAPNFADERAGSGMLLPIADMSQIMTLFYKLEKDKREFSQSFEFLCDVLGEGRREFVESRRMQKNHSESFDWRVQFVAGDGLDVEEEGERKRVEKVAAKVCRVMRESLVKEISRAYLEQEQ